MSTFCLTRLSPCFDIGNCKEAQKNSAASTLKTINEIHIQFLCSMPSDSNDAVCCFMRPLDIGVEEREM